MAVLPMKRIQIIGMNKDRKTVLELIQRLQSVEIPEAVSGQSSDTLETPKDDIFAKVDTSDARAIFDKNVQVAQEALGVLNQYAPEKKSLLDSLNGKRELSLQEFTERGNDGELVIEKARRILGLQKELIEARSEIPKIEAQIEALHPWVGMDLPLNFRGTSRTKAIIGAFPEKLSEEEIVTTIAGYAPDMTGIDVDVISSSDEQTCILLLCLKEDGDAVEEALRRMNFARPPLSDVVPSKQIEGLRGDLERAQKEVERRKTQIAKYAPERENLEFVSDYYKMRSDKYDVLGRLSRSKRTFILEGYVPERDVAEVERKLTAAADVYVEFTDIAANEEAPVLLKNNFYSEPVEGVVENYSMPSKGEIDPTVPVSCFYYILFGMMLSDAAYGLIMALATGILMLKYKKMEYGMKKTLRMFFFCGIGTIISGVLFGSYFGDMIPVVSRTFFGKEIQVWCWIDPLNQPMKMLVLSFAIAIVHLFAGLGILFYTDVKNGKIKDAIYDAVFWYMLVGGLIVFGLTTDIVLNMLQLSPFVPASVGQVGAIVAAIGAVGIVLTGGRESRNWFKRLLKGLYALYNVTGYLSDILSYSRLLALGLATSVISQVFNKMGTMGGNGFFGIIMFIVVAILGHSLNLAINALGAYVHTNRLTFVEFFGKFYEGGGKKFTPFAMNTKYYKIKEEN
ncbi:MAG: V-type ATP synthase subunit I [Lachnospiraceae bacterium]|nr:V-type ATP synthase subunit I [Lachnospiraceae bacterium]